jgi:hypothetical protein
MIRNSGYNSQIKSVFNRRKSMEPRWAENQLALKAEIGDWIKVSIRRHQTRSWAGITDEGTFTSTWDGYYLMTGDERVISFKHQLRDSFCEHAATHLYHGYYKTGEPHHQTETYNDFLGPFTLLTERERSKNLEILEDASHHLGNWVSGIPEWFDWSKKRFVSWSIGTQKVSLEKEFTFETLEHFRFVLMALDTYLAGGGERYLEFAKAYSDRWLELILQNKSIPGALFPDAESERIYLEKRKRISGISFVSDVHRIDGGGMADVFLTLYRLTHQQKYLDGLQIAFDQLQRANQEYRIYSEMQPRIMAAYRILTGDNRYDQWALDWLSTFEIPDEELECRLILEGDRMSWEYRLPDGKTIRTMPPEALLVLGYQITKEEKYLNLAFSLGRKKLWASQLLRDGREHGCDSRTISGVVRVSAAPLYAAVFGATLRFRSNINTLQVKYFKQDGSIGLPEGVAVLFEPTTPNERKLHFYNSQNTEQVVKVSAENTNLNIASVEASGCIYEKGEQLTVCLPAKNLAVVLFSLE